MLLEGKTALVTGASRNIGKAIAEGLIAAGASVIVGYQNNADAAKAVADSDPKGKSHPLQIDVGDRASIKQATAEIKTKFGEIDILVNNAGINRPEDFDKISDKDWDDVLNTNLKGPFMVSQVLLPNIKDGGAIVNISSVSGQYGGPRTTHYAVSKAGLNVLTQNLAIFCAKRSIRVNTVSPGLIKSEMAAAAAGLGVEEKILLGRMGETSEVADAVVFLVSDKASYITAQTINVNGGIYF
ncbi:MAG: 3-oxoacyl-ACP reductase FabG [Sphingomonadales bacterium]|nr:3-oxoacyl-ACP reductase FabG [Sphingomonadales bacterium]